MTFVMFLVCFIADLRIVDSKEADTLKTAKMKNTTGIKTNESENSELLNSLYYEFFEIAYAIEKFEHSTLNFDLNYEIKVKIITYMKAEKFNIQSKINNIRNR